MNDVGMKLYELPHHIMICKELLEGDDIDQESYDNMVQTLCETIEDEAESLLKMILESEGDLAKLVVEIKRLQEMKDRVEKSILKKRKFISDIMEMSGIKSLPTPIGKFSVRKSESLEIIDQSVIPSDFIKTETVIKVDKMQLKKLMKEQGLNEVAGAKIVVKNNLQIK